MTKISRIAPLAALLLAQSAGAAQTPAPKPPQDCAAPEHRAFDFWLGTWSVTAKGKPAGTNRITSDLKGCVLVEQWTSAAGNRGTSLNFYDRATKSWHQTWMDEGGNALHLKGGLRDGRMVMETDPAAAARHRITWSREPEGRVRQLWESSKDGGRSWTTVFEGIYAKAP
jgi:hypothetical protein